MGRRSLVASLIAAALGWNAAPAHACGPGGATGASPAPRQGAVVPANLPAIHVFPGWSYSGACSFGSVGLTKGQSEPVALIPSSSEPNVHLLTSELEPGASYVLDYTGPCAFGGPLQVVFQTAATQPLPKETGKLEVVASGSGFISWYQGSCSWGVGGAWVRLRLRPSCDLVPFLPVTRFTAEAGGKLWWSSGVGSTSAPANEILDSTTVDLIYAPCSDAGPSWRPSPGTVPITLRAHVVGATIDPAPATLTVDLTCDGDASSSPPPQPAGGLVDLAGPCISDFDASPPSPDAPDGPDDAGAADDGASGEEAPEDAGAGGSAGSPAEDACCDVGEPRDDAARQPTPDLRAVGGCSHDSRPPDSGLTPLLVIFAGGLCARRHVRRR